MRDPLAEDRDNHVGGRAIGAHHVGLSIVATDVGGGFSIGLGGLGFAMGLAGSWLLFAGFWAPGSPRSSSSRASRQSTRATGCSPSRISCAGATAIGWPCWPP